MKSIGIKDLKDNLSSYLEYVKNGETILVLDRNNPIAEIKKFIKTENKTELFIREGVENKSLIPAKNFKQIKITKSRMTAGITKEEMSKTWKSIYNDERS